VARTIPQTGGTAGTVTEYRVWNVGADAAGDSGELRPQLRRREATGASHSLLRGGEERFSRIGSVCR
jgi:hypothetical protein